MMKTSITLRQKALVEQSGVLGSSPIPPPASPDLSSWLQWCQTEPFGSRTSNLPFWGGGKGAPFCWEVKQQPPSQGQKASCEQARGLQLSTSQLKRARWKEWASTWKSVSLHLHQLAIECSCISAVFGWGQKWGTGWVYPGRGRGAVGKVMSPRHESSQDKLEALCTVMYCHEKVLSEN